MMPRIGLLFLTALLVQCGNPEKTREAHPETIPAQLQETDDFHGSNCMYHAARITDMGDRRPSSPGYRKQLDYLKGELFKHGWECEEQAFEAPTPQGLTPKRAFPTLPEPMMELPPQPPFWKRPASSPGIRHAPDSWNWCFSTERKAFPRTLTTMTACTAPNFMRPLCRGRCRSGW